MSERTPRKRAAALVRVSTDQQADKGGSITDQEQRIARWCADHQYDLVETYGHEDRSAGHLDTSPDFVRMLDDAEAGLWDAVVVESIDRFRRNIVDALVARQRLREAGRKLHIITFGDADMTLDEGAGLWLFTFGSAQAHAERESFKQRGAKGHRTKIARAQWNGGRAPTGYQAVPRGEGERTRSLEKSPAYEEHIAFLWARLLDGWATHRIARALTERGCVPPLGGKRFSQPSVANIAHNPIYSGLNWAYDDDGKKIPGQLGKEGDWEAYVTPDEWRQVQEQLGARRNRNHNRMGRPSSSFLLAGGLAICGECGERMWVRKDDHSDYYACSSIKTATPCGMPRLAREKVDLAVRRYMVHGPQLMDVSKALDRAWEFVETENAASKDLVRKLEAKLATYERQIAELEAGDELDDDLKDLYRAKKRLRAETQKKLDAAREDAERVAGAAKPSKKIAKQLIEAYREDFEHDAALGLEDLQERLRSTVEGVVIKRAADPHLDEYEEITWRTDPAPVALRLRWREGFVQNLVESIDPAWLASATGEGPQIAFAGSRRRRAGIRARDRPPRRAPST